VQLEKREEDQRRSYMKLTKQREQL
jgi:hypothetical protein